MYAYHFYFNRLMEIAVTLWDWENLPGTVSQRFLEITLFEKGYALYFNDDVLGNLALPCTLNGNRDVYNIPIRRRAYANNGYHAYRSNRDSVIIFNNYLHTNEINQIRWFAKRLYQLDSIIDINANAQKTPILIQGDENEKLTLANLFKDYDGNAPVIYTYKTGFKTGALTVLKTDAPYVADRIYTLKQNIWNEALSYLGVDNLNPDKKSQLVGNEITQYMGGTYASRNSRETARQDAANEINQMFGTNISVVYNEKLANSLIGMQIPEVSPNE